jgi:hypothetical protein
MPQLLCSNRSTNAREQSSLRIQKHLIVAGVCYMRGMDRQPFSCGMLIEFDESEFYRSDPTCLPDDEGDHERIKAMP